ncbi:MAG: hypothetical protein GY861_16285 [bacterium]|nr:hypothetical protein [bacterium]
MKPLLIFIFVLILSETACAQGIGVSPNSVDFQITERFDKKQIIIYNPNHENTSFNISASDWFHFSEQNGEIAAESSKKIIVKAKPPSSTRNGDYTESIHINFFTPNDKLSIQLGTAVKAAITITRSKISGPLISLTIIIAGLAIYRLVH